MCSLTAVVQAFTFTCNCLCEVLTDEKKPY
jgi:hypothetical protein